MRKVVFASMVLVLLSHIELFSQKKTDVNELAQEMVEKVNHEFKLTPAQKAKLKLAAKSLISANMSSEQDLKTEKGHKTRAKAWDIYKITVDSILSKAQDIKIDSMNVNK